MSDEQQDPRVTRRTMLAATAGVVVSAPLLTPGVDAVAAAAAVRFFTPAELALVDELTEIVVPTDAHSLGARAAGVAPYLDARLAESFDEALRTSWRRGLKAVDALSTTLHGKPFMQSSPAERLAVVTKMAEAESAPKSETDKFFVLLKAATIRAYYTSKIGLLQEMEYKGNTMLQDFVGTDVSK
jgi:Gluconate 2-dehydrogenase subunit 3